MTTTLTPEEQARIDVHRKRVEDKLDDVVATLVEGVHILWPEGTVLHQGDLEEYVADYVTLELLSRVANALRLAGQYAD